MIIKILFHHHLFQPFLNYSNFLTLVDDNHTPPIYTLLPYTGFRLKAEIFSGKKKMIAICL